MKREFLKNLGLNDEQIDQIMQENGNDVNIAKAKSSSELETAKKEIETLKSAQAEFDKFKTDTAEKYKNYDELAKFKADYEENQLQGKRLEYLKAQGCKHPDLVAKTIDWSKGTWDEGKKTFNGLDEDMKQYKETYKDLFEPAKAPSVNPQPGQGGNGNSSEFEKWKAAHPNLKWN